MTNFDERAKDWDSDPKKVNRAFEVADAIRKAVPLTHQMHAFEYGCGTGLLSFALKDEFEHITLADTSQGMLDVLKEKIAASGVTNMQPLHLDLTTEPAPAEKFHITYSLLTLHHIQNTEDILKKFHELLMPNGFLIIADLDKEDGSFHTDGTVDVHKGFAHTKLQEQVEKAGFEDVRFSIAHIIKKEIDGKKKRIPSLPDGGKKESRIMRTIEGELEAYWEQGWEGRIEFAFHYEGLKAPFFLENGQSLTIYNSDKTVRWSGKIDLVKRNTWFDKHKLNAEVWSYTKQKGVAYADWMDWFWHNPPLKAKLDFEE